MREREREHVCECDIWSTLMGLVVIAPAVAYKSFTISIHGHPTHWHYLSLLQATSATVCISNTGLLCPNAVNGDKMERFCIGRNTCLTHITLTQFLYLRCQILCCPLGVSPISECPSYSFPYNERRPQTRAVTISDFHYMIIMAKNIYDNDIIAVVRLH